MYFFMKKKMLLLTVFVLGLVLCLYDPDAKNVKAAEVCETHTNYYFLLDAKSKGDLLNGMEDGINVRPHTKTFALGIPTKIIKKGVTEISSSSTDDEDDPSSMSLRKFYNTYSELSDSEAYNEDGLVHYIWSSTWNNVGTGESGSDRNIPSSYSAFKSAVIYAEDVDADITVDVADEDEVTLKIERTYNQEDVEALDIDDEDMVYSPSVYYFQYKVCTEDTTEYKTVAHYIDQATGNEFSASNIETGLLDGDTYEGYTCPTTMSDKNGNSYKINEPTSFESGEIEGEDVNWECYYKKDVKKATLTINFGTNGDCSDGKNIKTSITQEYNVGDTVKYSLPGISGYEFSEVGTISPSISLTNRNNQISFTMPNKNTTVCLVYTKNPQTGSGLLYFAWIVAIAALAYSGWYFVKYYKNRNNEI